MYRHPMQRPRYHQEPPPAPRRKPFPKYRYIIGSLLLTSVVMLATTVGTTLWNSGRAAKASAGTFSGLTNLGMPTAPQIFRPSDYAVTLNYRDPMQQAGAPSKMNADHGADCAAPPATHTTGLSFEDGVYICHDHVMTATNSNDSGYSNIYIEPPAMLDWSQGTATLNISMSTFRTAARDWVDFWLTPFAEQSPDPINPNIVGVDGQGPPRDAINIEMLADDSSAFDCAVFQNGQDVTDCPRSARNLHDVLTPSKTVRTPFQFQISRTRIRFGIPSLNVWFIDQAVSLNFTQAVFQFGQHSYTPYKEDPGAPPEQAALGLQAAPDTWHWSDLMMSPAVPITIINPTEASEPDHLCDSCTLQFPTPAPAGAYIRYRGVAFDSTISLSFNNGATWVPSVPVASSMRNCCHMEVYYQPIPEGTTSVKVRGLVRDAIVTASSSSTQLPPTGVAPTPTPAAAATPSTQPASPGSTQLQNTPCMITVNGTMVNGVCTGSFTPTQ